MKKFTCCYVNKSGGEDATFKYEAIETASAEEAAYLYSERYPSDNPTIRVTWGLVGICDVDNTLTITQKKEDQRERLLARQRMESILQSIQTLESADGTLRNLPYDDLITLIENMRDFPGIRDELNPEERAVREELYKTAFFNRDLQAGLMAQQAELQTSLLNQIASGQPTASAAGPGKSNLAAAAALGGVAALQKLNQIEENTGDVSEGLGFD